MNNDTSSSVICKNTEYRYSWEKGFNPVTCTFTILVNKETKAQQEMFAINKKLAGEPYFPCQCPKCRTTAR
jgi:hypothetical protein